MTANILNTSNRTWESKWEVSGNLPVGTPSPGTLSQQGERKRTRSHGISPVPRQAELLGVTIEQQRR
ncbi:MAG TPA: hypothetical protein GX720_04700 [Clostridiaceae bacterium]|nr:hypothetical protein [Clostridiaceae bacterium]